MAVNANVGGTLRLQTGEVDLGRQRLVTPNGVVSLTTRETELLAYLSARAGEAVSRDSLLTDVWNYRASNPTRAVDLAVKRLRAKIEPDPTDPVHILSVHGVGYRFVPLEVGVPAPAVGRPQTVRTNLTSERTTFVGRSDELARMRELLQGGCRLLTITGPAGTGKTRLARHLGLDLLDSYPGGVWFVDLAEIPVGTDEGQTTAGRADKGRVDDILSAVASSVGLSTAGNAGPDEIGLALADRGRDHGPLLLMFDNFEHLVEHAAGTLGAWLDLPSVLQFVVTSRERLHVRGERILELCALPPADGLALILERAQAVRRGLDLSATDREVLEEVVDRLDGIPLAIELAASRLGSLSPLQLRERLASRFRLLGDPNSDRPARHATLEAALDWSWDLMRPEEQRALSALSVFRGGFSLEAAEEVLEEADDPDAPWPADLVQSLRDKSLLAMDDLAGGDLRYRLLESIRAYANGKLVAGGDEERIRRLHAQYYLVEAEDLTARLHTAAGVDRMADLDRERHNLIAVARLAPEPQMRVRALLCLFPVLQARGPVALLDELVGEAIELPRGDLDLEVALLGRLLVDRGFHHFARGRIHEARADFRRAMALSGDHPEVVARARMGEGRVLQAMGQLDEAVAVMRQSIDGFAHIGDRSGEGRARTLYATVLTWQGHIAQAEAEYERALRVLRRVKDRWTEGVLYANLAAFLMERMRDPEAAERRAAHALEMLSEIGDHRACVALLTGFGVASVRMGRVVEALPKLEEAMDRARRMGDRAQEGTASAKLGWALFEHGDLGGAETRVDSAVTILREARDRCRLAVALRIRACIRQEQGRWLEAEQIFQESLQILRTSTDRMEHAVSALQYAFLKVEQGHGDVALELLAEANEHASGEIPWLKLQAMAMSAVVWADRADIDRAEAVWDTLEQAVDPRDPRESALLPTVAALLALRRARLRDPGSLDAAVSVAVSLVTGPIEDRGAGERRVVLRLIERDLDRTR